MFWDVMPCPLVVTDVSNETTALIFRVNIKAHESFEMSATIPYHHDLYILQSSKLMLSVHTCLDNVSSRR